jgi:hypothetical protein
MSRNYCFRIAFQAVTAIFILAAACHVPVHAASASPSQGDEWSSRNQYRIIGANKNALTLAVKQHLIVADRLLRSRLPEERIKGVGVALAAAVCASERIEDHALAINITERYLLPNRKLAPESPWEYMSRDRITTTAINIYERAGKNAKIIEVGKTWIEANPEGAITDAIRAKVARAYIKLGQKSEAIRELKQISDTSNMSGSKLWLAETTPATPNIKNSHTTGLANIFTNMPGATELDIAEDGASRLTNGSSKYPSLPIKAPYTVKFGGGLTAKSEGVQLAIASDSPVKVYINGELAYHAPETKRTMAAPRRPSPATSTTQIIPVDMEEGELYDIQIEYTKSTTESGGITLFAYGGDAELTAPQMGPLEPESDTGKIKVQYLLTFTGPGSEPLPNVSMRSKEAADSVHVCPWNDHGYGTRTDHYANGVLTCTWTWDWNTLPEHNGNHTQEYTVHWARGSATTSISTLNIKNLSITDISPRPIVLASSGTTTVAATCQNSNLSNITSTLELLPLTNTAEDPDVTTNAYRWTLTGTEESKGIYSYNATITGEASKPAGDSGTYPDTVTYRSQYLTTTISATYGGHDEQGDNYNIAYTVADSKNKNAATGYINIYGPDGSVKQTISGIDVTLGTHNIVFTMPDTWPAGEYTAVLITCDDNGPAYRDHLPRWAVDTAATIQKPVSVPEFSPDGGTFTDANHTVTITCATEGATIYYTTDGSDPTPASPAYASPIPIDHTLTLKARAYKDGWAPSAIKAAQYIVDIDTIAPSPGTAASPAHLESGNITVTYTGAIDNIGGTGLKIVELWCKKDTGAWTNTGQSQTTGSGSFTFIPDGDGRYYFDLVAEDNAGNRSPIPTGSGDCHTLYGALDACAFVNILMP